MSVDVVDLEQREMDYSFGVLVVQNPVVEDDWREMSVEG